MERNEFINYMNTHKIYWREEDGKIHVINSGDINIFTDIPSGVIFDNTGNIELRTKYIPSGTRFNNSGWVDGFGTEEIGDNVIFDNRSHAILNSLKKIGENVTFNGKGYSVYFTHLPVLSKGIRFFIGGEIHSKNKGLTDSPNLKGISSSKIINCMISQLYG